MSTSYRVPIEAFFRRVEKDRDYFNYFNLSEEQAMKLAEQRALGYLNEAIGELTMKCAPDVDFNDRDDATQEFSFDLTNQEVFLLSSLMYEMYLNRDIAMLKCWNVNFTATDLRVFDPSRARSTFLEMYKFVCEQNARLISEYSSRDRETGVLKGIDYSSYDVDE